MHRFSFRSPPKKTTKNKATKVTPSLLSSPQPSPRRPSLRLFKRRLTRTPSLDELASPIPCLPSECGREDGDMDDDDGNSQARVEDEDDSEDDERERLRRAKVRAMQMRAVAAASDHSTYPRPKEYATEVDEEEDEDEGAEDDDDDYVEGLPEMRLSSDVAELQRQVRALLHARIQAEDAWHQESAQLCEQLTLAEARTQSILRSAGAGSKRPTAGGTDRAIVTPTPRERELLRLLVHVVGKEHIHTLLAAPTPAGVNPSAELRRQLLARAKAPQPMASRRPGTQTPLAKRHATPSPVKVSETTGPTPTTLLLCGARKHEMSAAM